MKYIFEVLTLLVLSRLTIAQPVWQDISPLPGHDVQWVSERPTNSTGLWTTVCYEADSGVCSSDIYRPYYSADNGETWELRDNGIPWNMAVNLISVNPLDPDVLLACISDPPEEPAYEVYPYRSTDRGLTWQQVTSGILPELQWAATAGWFADGIHAWCITQLWTIDAERWYTSEDGGVTWIDLGYAPDFTYYPVFTTPLVPSMVVAVGDVVRRSLDYGDNWELLWDSDHLAEQRIGGYGQEPGVLYASAFWYTSPQNNRYWVPAASADTGHTWQLLNPQDTLRWASTLFTRTARLLVDQTNLNHMLFMRSDSLFESADHGESWECIYAGPLEAHKFTFVGYNTDNNNVFVAGTNDYNSSFTEGLWRLDRSSAINKPESHSLPSNICMSIFPNPFNATTSLSLTIASRVNVRLETTDLLGRHIATLHNGMLEAGEHKFTFDASALPSGIYFTRVQAGEFVKTQKLLLLK